MGLLRSTSPPPASDNDTVEQYAYLFTPFWKGFDAILGVIGIWLLLQPSALVESYSAMIFSRERGDKIGLPSTVTTELLAISNAREAVRYDTRALRLIGAAFVVAGLIGLSTGVSQPVLVSALAVVTVAALTLVLVGGKLTTPTRAAFLDRVADNAVPWWLVIVLVLESTSEAVVGTGSSFAVAGATLICAAALLLLRSLPVFLAGSDLVLEREMDRRFRVARVGLIALFTQLPSLVWSSSVNEDGLWSIAARLVVSGAMISVIAFIATSSRRLDVDLRRTVTDRFT
jgi:hypothetical protein